MKQSHEQPAKSCTFTIILLEPKSLHVGKGYLYNHPQKRYLLLLYGRLPIDLADFHKTVASVPCHFSSKLGTINCTLLRGCFSCI